jgi:hypothetical protein
VVALLDIPVSVVVVVILVKEVSYIEIYPNMVIDIASLARNNHLLCCIILQLSSLAQ